MSTWVWAGVLLAALWAAHWGAEHLEDLPGVGTILVFRTPHASHELDEAG